MIGIDENAADPASTTMTQGRRRFGRRFDREFGLLAGRRQLRTHDVESGVQLRAEGHHRGDDGHRDAGGDQTVFDGGRAGFVVYKPLNELLHRLLLNSAPLQATDIAGRRISTSDILDMN